MYHVDDFMQGVNNRVSEGLLHFYACGSDLLEEVESSAKSTEHKLLASSNS